MRAMFIVLSWFLSLVAQASDKPCLDEAIALLRADPNGLAVYLALDDRAGFAFWLDCDSIDYDVSSAVHESVHLLSRDRDPTRYAFWQVGGKRLVVPWSDSPARSAVVGRLRKDELDGYVETYLRGPSGEQGIELILDELNAYTHGLTTEVALAPRNEGTDRRTGARDGVAHFQLYLVLYLQELRRRHAQQHMELSATHGHAVAALWKQSEEALAASLPFASLGIDDRWYLYRAWDPKLLAELDRFVGGRTWSSTLQARFRRDPPRGPQPPSQYEGESTERRQQQKQVRATLQLGETVYEYEETWPSGVVVLLVDGARAEAVKTWSDLESLGLPPEVMEALRPSHDQLHAD